MRQILLKLPPFLGPDHPTENRSCMNVYLRHHLGMSYRGKKTRAGSIADQLRERISTLASNSLFTGELVLAEEFGVCRATINKVLKSLEGEGLLVSHQGRGRFVLGRKASQAPTIAILLDNLDSLHHPVMARRMKGISQAIAGSSYHLSVFARNPALEAKELLEGLLGFLAEAQGVLLATFSFEERIVYEVAARYPTVWLEHPSDRSGVHGVRSDYLGAGFIAAQHLIGHGHSHIAVVGLDDTVSSCRQHADGVRLAVQQSNLKNVPIRLERWVTDAFSPEAGAKVVLSHLQSTSERPSGLLFASDDLAAGGAAALKEICIDIPLGMSLVGCNGVRQEFAPEKFLTTVELDFEESGRRSVEVLKQIIENTSSGIEVGCHPATLFQGDSVSMAPGAGLQRGE